MNEEQEPEYRVVNYICDGCKARREVVLSSRAHLKRSELSESGLAPYIDIHTDPNYDDNQPHGIKLFVDVYFQVRSNDLIGKSKKHIQSKVGLPSPVFSLNQQKLMYSSKSWNSFELASLNHNVGYFLIDTDPSTQEADNKIHIVKSSLETVEIKLSFKRSLHDEEYVENCLKWADYLARWMEGTARLNTVLLPRIFYYIDLYTVRPPNETDELVLSILLDGTAKISSTGSNLELREFLDIETHSRETASRFFSLLGININALAFIIKVLNERSEMTIWEYCQVVSQHPNKDEFLDTFILIFFELVQRDLILYSVSHLL